MSLPWYEEFLQKLREFRTHCADTLRPAVVRDKQQLNTLPISRALDALERHWKKQFPQHTLPHRDEIDKHRGYGHLVDVIDLMTKDIHDAEVKALAALGNRRVSPATPFVATERLEELKSLSETSEFDLAKMIRICEELNMAAERSCHISTALLVRALVDHVPPLFGSRTFSEVANNYAGTKSSKSFRGVAKHLEDSLRKIADGLLHTQIRKTESLPSATQVDFRQSVDVLLGEATRIIREVKIRAVP